MTFKHIWVLVSLAVVIGVRGQSVPEKSVEVILGIDKIEKLDFIPDSRVQIGNEALINYTIIPEKREIILKGQRPGKTSVVLRNSVGDIKARFLVSIIATDQSKLVKSLRELIGDIEGIEIGIKGEMVYVGGQIVVPSDIGRIVTIITQKKFESVLFLVELSPQTQRMIARKMQEEIQKNQLRDVTVRVVNKLFWLEGVVDAPWKKVLAEQIATAFFPDQLPSLAERTDSVKVAVKAPIQNFISVNEKKRKRPIPKLFKVTAQFVELAKDYKKVFGFQWQPLLTDGQGSLSFGRSQEGGVKTTASNTLAGTISNLFPKLASAKSAGHAKVIQSGVIIVKEKVEGVLSKNETIPFALGTGEFTRAQKAEAGFTLRVKPALLDQEKIELNMNVRISAVVGSPPQSLSNSITTILIVKSKESAVLGGVVVNKSNTGFDRNPPGGVSEIPEGSSPLFSFIRSKNMTSSKSQFAVFVTPEIIASASQDTQEIRRKFRRRKY